MISDTEEFEIYDYNSVNKKVSNTNTEYFQFYVNGNMVQDSLRKDLTATMHEYMDEFIQKNMNPSKQFHKECVYGGFNIIEVQNFSMFPVPQKVFGVQFLKMKNKIKFQ